jgi:hypothetical protein
LRTTAITGSGIDHASKFPTRVSADTGAILMSQSPFPEIAVKSLLICALWSVSHLMLTLLTGMWALQALLFSLLSMWASASPGLPGESELFNNYKHSSMDMRVKRFLHVYVTLKLCIQLQKYTDLNLKMSNLLHN